MDPNHYEYKWVKKEISKHSINKTKEGQVVETQLSKINHKYSIQELKTMKKAVEKERVYILHRESIFFTIMSALFTMFSVFVVVVLADDKNSLDFHNILYFGMFYVFLILGGFFAANHGRTKIKRLETEIQMFIDYKEKQ